MLDRNDISFIESRGLIKEVVEEQLVHFRNGFPFLGIVRSATIDSGIVRPGDVRLKELAALYDDARDRARIVKFVPASGAATRMFKDLFEFTSTGISNKVSDRVLAQLDGFAFADTLKSSMPEGASEQDVVGGIIKPLGLGYGEKPKALILFHNYGSEVRTALEEHLVEGAQYASCGGNVNIHFTVSPEHIEGFNALIERVKPVYEKRYGVKYHISLSIQKSSTDTIAVNPDNTPFRNPDGTLLFRPAGHGALIANLGDIDADIVFIKNIDNVTTDSRRADTILYKKVIAGVLMEVQAAVFAYLKRLDVAKPDASLVADAEEFVRNVLNVTMPPFYVSKNLEGRAAALRKIFDRPIRVCGMVRNEGEPGGGPFFALNPDSTISLQIVEASQVSPEQKKLLSESTHFNPVDLVCGLKDFRGRRFELSQYVDHSTGFISEKSKDGKALKAQELPGLWNGAMSDWNTIFVEVPVSTFTPVKVVTDLLRDEHKN